MSAGPTSVCGWLFGVPGLWSSRCFARIFGLGRLGVFDLERRVDGVRCRSTSIVSSQVGDAWAKRPSMMAGTILGCALCGTFPLLCETASVSTDHVVSRAVPEFRKPLILLHTPALNLKEISRRSPAAIIFAAMIHGIVNDPLS